MSHWDEGRPPDAPRLRPRHVDQGRDLGASTPTPPRGAYPTPPPARPTYVPPDEEDDLVIRPFLLTGGRTRATVEGLAVESLVQAEPAAATDTLRFEARRIVEICWQPTSVAELSAALRLPLGVVRVLVSDLVAEGRVTVVRREQLSIQMMERIRDRVRAL